MANYGIIIPVRNDLLGVNLQVEDLHPNTSQKNSNLDGEGQSGYVRQMADRPAATVFVGEEYSTGSRMQTGAGAAAALAAAADWSTGPAGNDSRATATPAVGLAAYLRERVVNDPTGAADTMAAADLDLIVTDLLARVVAGQSMTLGDINVIIQARCLAGAGDGTEVLNDVTDLAVLSFGKVSDVLRILSGEVYFVPTNCIIADNAGAFIPWTHPDGLGEVVGGVVETRRGFLRTPTAAQLAAVPRPTGTGRWLVEGEEGFVPKKGLALNDAFRLSASSGKLRALHDNSGPTVIDNTNAYAYVAGDVDANHIRAIQIDGTNIAASAANVPAITVYDDDGNLLNVP